MANAAAMQIQHYFNDKNADMLQIYCTKQMYNGATIVSDSTIAYIKVLPLKLVLK